MGMTGVGAGGRLGPKLSTAYGKKEMKITICAQETPFVVLVSMINVCLTSLIHLYVSLEPNLENNSFKKKPWKISKTVSFMFRGT